MTKPKIVTITNPTELVLAQLAEIREGNTRTRNEIERLRSVLRGGEKEEIKLETELEKLLVAAREAKRVK